MYVLTRVAKEAIKVIGVKSSMFASSKVCSSRETCQLNRGWLTVATALRHALFHKRKRIRKVIPEVKRRAVLPRT